MILGFDVDFSTGRSDVGVSDFQLWKENLNLFISLLCSLNCVALCIAKTITNSENEMLFCFSFFFVPFKLIKLGYRKGQFYLHLRNFSLVAVFKLSKFH